MNQVFISGNLGQDPDIRYFESGTCKARFTVAIYAGKDKNTGEEKPPSWVTVDSWGKTAEIAAKLKKGDRAMVEGRLNQERWADKESGQNRSALTVIANTINKIEKPPKTEQGQSTEYDEMPF